MVNVGIVGIGLVGSELVSQILKSSCREAFKVVGLTTSQKMVVSDSDYKSLSISTEDNLRSTVNATGVQTNLEEFASYLAKSKDHSVIVDCTASEQVANLYPAWLRAGLSVVTPNKKAFSSSLDLFKEIQELAANTSSVKKHARTPLIYHETTVGAGLPVLSTLTDFVKTGDQIVRIEGIFSGTLSYLFNNYSTLTGSSADAKPFSEIVRIAKELGYTEPDPRDDLNGMDVARKVKCKKKSAGN